MKKNYRIRCRVIRLRVPVLESKERLSDEVIFEQIPKEVRE